MRLDQTNASEIRQRHMHGSICCEGHTAGWRLLPLGSALLRFTVFKQLVSSMHN